jgi:uncharacterized damage-inducible protein DinB
LANQQSAQPADLRYPIGRYLPPETINARDLALWINELAALPAHLRRVVTGLSDDQLETPYRPDGWTVRQVAHHLADSHMNSYIRFKLALSKDTPAIVAYDESAWAEMEDGKRAPIHLSLTLLEALHARWVLLLESMTEGDFSRAFKHPEYGAMRLDWALGLYAWHSRHHVAQIEALRSRQGWDISAT